MSFATEAQSNLSLQIRLIPSNNATIVWDTTVSFELKYKDLEGRSMVFLGKAYADDECLLPVQKVTTIEDISEKRYLTTVFVDEVEVMSICIPTRVVEDQSDDD